jgi:hypothetical protein
MYGPAVNEIKTCFRFANAKSSDIRAGLRYQTDELVAVSYKEKKR